MIRYLAAISLFLWPCYSQAQLANDLDRREQSEMSRILKSSGSLLLRESHVLQSIGTNAGHDIGCRVLVVKNLLAGPGSDAIAVGLVLSQKEEFSENTAYVDPDEIDGLLASLEMIEREGVALLNAALIEETNSIERSSEIHFSTKDGVRIGAFAGRSHLGYAMKVSHIAEWSILNSGGVEALIDNLGIAQRMAKSAQ